MSSGKIELVENKVFAGMQEGRDFKRVHVIFHLYHTLLIVLEGSYSIF